MDTTDQFLESKSIYPRHTGKGHGRFRYALLLLSLAMLIVTFNSPESAWLIDFGVLGYQIHGNAFYWLFMFSIITYIPLAAGGVILFLYDLTQLLKNKKLHHAVILLVFSTINFSTLYRFNNWVFGSIF